MAPPIMLLLLLTSFLIPTQTQFQVEAKDEAFTSIVISQKGLDFLKELLVTEAVSSIIPLQIPRIEKSVRFPFLGSVEMVVSNIKIYGIDVGSSYVKLGDDGIAIIASKTTCNLSMNWYYSYTTWVAPIEVEDEGSASVQVEGMEVGLTLGLEIQEGTLKLSLKDCGCYVKEISIKLDGGASWFYQGMINAFEEQIGSAVENAITKKLKRWDLSEYLNKDTKALVACSDPSKMLGIALDEAVFNSVAATYFDAEFMQWIVDKIPDQSFLNTAGYRFIIPQLYKKYPNHDMNLNISLSSPPIIKISEHDIGAIIYADLIIDVLDEDGVIPVACISLVIRGSSSVKISGNNLAGNMKVDDFSMSLKWSNIGNLHMYLIQPVVWTGIQTVFVPYVNKHLGKGIPLPIVHGFTIQNGELLCSDSRIMVCSDMTYEPSDSHNLNWLLPSLSKYTHAT
ncbi:hypothetical protein ACLB2K_062284 [Fragaria x ananassa]